MQGAPLGWSESRPSRITTLKSSGMDDRFVDSYLFQLLKEMKDHWERRFLGFWEIALQVTGKVFCITKRTECAKGGGAGRQNSSSRCLTIGNIQEDSHSPGK